jgi:hypothetical protein
MQKKFFILTASGLIVLFFLALGAVHAEPDHRRSDLILFGRGTYPGDDSSYDLIRGSGFTTMILSSFYLRGNGDLVSGDDGHNPIIHNGQFVGNEEWMRRVRSLKGKHSSIKRVEILLEGRWYKQPPNTYDFLRDWISGDTGEQEVIKGTEPGSTIHTIARLLKEKLDIDALCIDDESVYDSVSIVRLGSMLHGLGMHMTLCPFTKIPWWKGVLDAVQGGVVDAVYLQCYDGGKNNIPGDWVQGMGTKAPVYPIFLCRGAFSTCGVSHNSKSPEEIRAQMKEFATGAPGIHGGGIWQLADIKDYVRRNCVVEDPSSGTSKTAKEYLEQLKRSLTGD